jgi:tRNA G18 (ribose-2'-O)-methylase SpoU
LTLTIFPDGVENPANVTRIRDAARLLGASCSDSIRGRLIAIENTPRAQAIYGRRPLEGHATIAVGHERRGLSERTLAMAAETLAIPTQSRTVTTLNVAAAAAVAAWYLLHGSAPQAQVVRPDARRPSVLLVGYDHVEVGSSLRSAAAFGFREVLLDDRGAGWFEGSPALRREARAAARRHKNPLVVRRASGADIERFDEVVFVLSSGPATPVEQTRVARGRNQLVVVGLEPNELLEVAPGRVRVATLGLQPFERPPLRLIASIVLAEIARQVGRRRRIPGRPAARPPRFEAALRLAATQEALWIDPSELLDY